jgi:hypothetical protein
VNDPDAFVMPTSFAPEPTALAYTPDFDKWFAQQRGDNEPETQVETVALAVESARRWAARTDLSPELRLRRIWTVLEAAIR